MAQVWQVQVAAPSKEVATELARGAVEARLAAGGQVVGPVTSTFWHLGEFGTGEEWQVVAGRDVLGAHVASGSGLPALAARRVQRGSSGRMRVEVAARPGRAA